MAWFLQRMRCFLPRALGNSHLLTCSRRTFKSGHILSKERNGSFIGLTVRSLSYQTMATPGQLEHDKLFSDVTDLVKEYLIKYKERSSKVVDFKSPEEIQQLVDLKLYNDGTDDETILTLCRKVLEYSVHTAHPRFYNQLFSGVDEIGLMGLFLTAVTNTSMYTFEMAPVFSLMEGEVLKKMRDLIGWKSGDGIFAPGGSISNLYGLLLARFQRFPESKSKGILNLPQMAFFCSEQSHYSVLKSSIIMGIGMENVIKVKCDQRGKMIASELEKEIESAKSNGITPVAVICTSGTTVIGAFDPIDEIAPVCEKHSVWIHVDAAFGGSVLVSRSLRNKAAGIHRADSVTWNPHKSLGVPLQCSAFLTKHEGLLSACNSTKANYLFQQDKVSYDVSYDTGDKSIQCGRLNDVLKLWLIWKKKGLSGLEMQVDQACSVASYLAQQIKSREGFHLLLEPEYTNVCFWYLPSCLRHITPSCEATMDDADRLAKVAPTVKARMVSKGSLMMTYQPLPGGIPNFFRMTLSAPKATKEDMDYLLDEIDSLGYNLDV